MRALALLFLLATAAAHAHSPRKGVHADSDDEDAAAIKKYEATIATTTLPTPEKLKEDKECAYTRQDAIECATRHGDLNHDGRIDKAEIESLKLRMLPWYVRTLAWAASYTTSYLQWKCGDEHGFITLRSLEAKKNLCIQHCTDWTRFMGYCEKMDEE